MKKLLGLALLLIPSFCFADRLGSLHSSADVLLSTQGANLSSVIHSTDSLQIGATFYVSSGTVAGPLYINGGGDGSITATITGSTYTAVWSSGAYTVGQTAVFSSTNGTLIGSSSSGGSTPGGSSFQLQYNNGGVLGGAAFTNVWASSITVSTIGVLVNGSITSNDGFSGTGGPGILDIFAGTPYVQNRTLFAVGSGAQKNQFYVPNNHYVISTLGLQAGNLVVGDTSASGQRIYSIGDTNSFFDLRNGSSMTFNTGTANGPGDIRFQPASTLALTISNQSGITAVSSVSVRSPGGIMTTFGVNAATAQITGLGTNTNVCTDGSSNLTTSGCNNGTLTGNQTITLSGDSAGSGATAITVTNTSEQDNIKTFGSSITVNGSQGLSVKYGVSIGSITGAGLTTCGDSTHAVGWSSTNNQFTCQNVTGSGGSPTTTYTSSVTFQGGVSLSSGIAIDATDIISTTSTITSSMTVILASCTTRGSSPTPWIALNLGSASNIGEEHMIYDVGADSCSIKINAQPGELIESTGTIWLNAQTQHASIHALGNGLWGSGPGSIQYTPWSVFTTQDDVGTFTVATASDVYSCPIFIPIPIGFEGFRVGRSVSSGLFGFAITDMNGKYVVGVSSAVSASGFNNYTTGSVTQLSPGWYRLEVVLPSTALTINGSNSVNAGKMFCSKVGSSTSGSDLSGFTPTIPGTGDNRSYPAIDLLFNGGMQSY